MPETVSAVTLPVVPITEARQANSVPATTKLIAPLLPSRHSVNAAASEARLRKNMEKKQTEMRVEFFTVVPYRHAKRRGSNHSFAWAKGVFVAQVLQGPQ